MTTTITITDSTVHVQRESATETERSTYRCTTRRVAQVLAAELELRASGWAVRGPCSQYPFRRPLLLLGEKMGVPLDGALADDRAQGFTARRGDAVIVLDACAGMPALVLSEYGDTTEARRIAEWHLGSLS